MFNIHPSESITKTGHSGSSELEKERLGAPTWHELQELTERTIQENCELGMQVICLLNSEDRKKNFVRGTAKNIQAPKLKGKVTKVVFFHTHPPFSDVYSYGYNANNPLQILPSHESSKYLQTDGDFANTRGLQWGYEKGGYLNIATEDGVTLAIGVTAISDQEKVLSEIRKVQRLENKFAPATWKVWTGPSAGESFSDVMEFAKTGQPLVGEDGNALISFTDYQEGTQTYLLRLSWTVIEELNVSLDEICFGNGIEVITEKLKLQQFPHQMNLDQVNKLRVRPERNFRAQSFTRK